jgi:hypothetical protein
MYLWSGETTVKSAADTTGVSQKTIVQLYQYMRDKENISREERYNGRTGKKSTHGG